MTLFIVILSITNIALGYGLAIYLGHARTPPRTVRAARSQQAPEPAPVVDESWQVPAPTPSATVAYEPVAEPEPPALVVESPVAASAEPVAVAPEPPMAVVETPPIASVAVPEPPAIEATSEEDVLAKIEDVRAEIHETPEPTTLVETLAAEPAPAPETVEPVVEDDPAAKPVSKEALLESINAFQAQLKKQQELAKLHAVTSQS